MRAWCVPGAPDSGEWGLALGLVRALSRGQKFLDLIIRTTLCCKFYIVC
jgi:hypothetical protein